MPEPVSDGLARLSIGDGLDQSALDSKIFLGKQYPFLSEKLIAINFRRSFV
jgi:hypothetical protein